MIELPEKKDCTSNQKGFISNQKGFISNKKCFILNKKCFVSNKKCAPSNEKGFTLVEVLIAILALTLLSGFVLEMFLTASRVNQQAQDTDAGSTRAMSVIESFKQMDSPFDLEKDPLMAGARMDKSDGETRLSLYYDAQWNTNAAAASLSDAVAASASDAASDAASEVPSPGARFIMEVRVFQAVPVGQDAPLPPNAVNRAYLPDGAPVRDDFLEGSVYSILVQVYQLGSESDRTLLTELTSNHYFVYSK
jgi:prepilin-type N-terminal cleavage/methylation domain-containing protein